MRDIKLVYSSHDGYYFEEYTWDGIKGHPGYFRVSQAFPTREAARRALRRNKIEWEKNWCDRKKEG